MPTLPSRRIEQLQGNFFAQFCPETLSWLDLINNRGYHAFPRPVVKKGVLEAGILGKMASQKQETGEDNKGLFMSWSEMQAKILQRIAA